MTTQAELLALGESHRKASPAINTVMAAIVEAQAEARTTLASVKAQASTLGMGVDFQAGYCTMLDNSDLVVAAAKAAASMSLIASHLFTLACLLSDSGIEHSY